MDSLEKYDNEVEKYDNNNSIKELNKSFKTGIKSVEGVYSRVESEIKSNLESIIGIKEPVKLEKLQPTLMDITKECLDGTNQNGIKTMGLKDLKRWKLDKTSDYYYQNLKQQSGYAAEVLSTYKENMINKAKGIELKTCRTDDLQEIFGKNNQYVDKVRMDVNGNIVERIQTKFVGKNGNEWLSKMMSKNYEKYIYDGQVDKLECPKDYYEDIKDSITNRITKLEKQLERVSAEGKSEIADNIKYKIDKLNKIDKMVEQSNTTSKEAVLARIHPKLAVAKVYAPEAVKLGNHEGIKEGASAACITLIASTTDNVSRYLDGSISCEEMTRNILKETSASGALAYGTQFINTEVGEAMKKSSTQLIKDIGGSCLPAAAVSFSVESYDSISDFAKGDITGGKLAYDLGENAVGIASSVAIAAIAPSVVSGIVAGMVGYAVVTEAYTTAVEYGSKEAPRLGDKAQGYALDTYKTVREFVPEKAEEIKSSLVEYAEKVNLHISL